MIDIRSEFDAAMLESGPPAVFTVDAKGQLGLDEWRTREHYGRITGELVREVCHCLYRDRATGFVQYVVVTSPQLCASHPRQDVSQYDDQAAALAVLATLGNPPISLDRLA